MRTQSNDWSTRSRRDARSLLMTTSLDSLDPQNKYFISEAEKVGDLVLAHKVYPGETGVRALIVAPMFSCVEKTNWKSKEPVNVWRDRPRDWTYDEKQGCNVRRSNGNILQDRLELIFQAEGDPGLARVLYFGASIKLVKPFQERLNSKLVTGLGGERRLAQPYDCTVRFTVSDRETDDRKTFFDIIPSIEAWAGEPGGPSDEQRELAELWARKIAEERAQLRDPDDDSPSNVSPIRPASPAPSSPSSRGSMTIDRSGGASAARDPYEDDPIPF
jgi:hypothetical protein